MMTPEEFTKKHYQLDKMQISMVTLESATHLAKAYALHVLERLERDIDAYDESNLKPFLEEYRSKL